MRKNSWPVFAILLLLTLFTYIPNINSEQARIALLKIEGYISPATTEYVKTFLAESWENYDLLLITLDTLGGEAEATLEIIKYIQTSEKPVLCLVYPEGANAMSAGTYILMACKIAAMAPYTQVGACQPVVGGTLVNDTKTINFLSEKIASLARMNNRDETVARQFVTRNLVLGPEEALERKVIEVIARDPKEFLERVDGWNIMMRDRAVTLRTSDALIIEAGKPLKVFLMELLANPLISSVLLAIGIMTLILGFASPGWGAEVAGGIFILLGLIGQGFDVNLIGILLIGIGAALLVYEVFTHAFGAIAVGGMLSLGMGIILIAGSPPREQFVSQLWFSELLSTISIVLIVVSIFFGFLIFKAVQAVRSKPYLREIPSEYGRAVELITPGAEGYVKLSGELWKATSKKEVKPGQRVRVIGKVGDLLLIDPVEE